ncbi:MAG: dTMP kinase [Rhodospirillaceae bacterium]|nr:dTMP kinase [Rhodospirillaceae bacterium]|tara:strand:+ start:1321 stop:1959 length:639 start_codon:yes stop_codon:yes gene_type:complete
MSQGVFITVEGGEGAGKSTQLALLENYLTELGIDLLRTREPGGVPSAEIVRELLIHGDGDRWSPLTETLLHFAARHEHVSRLIRPAIAEGKWVLCDRFADSTTAYQGYAQDIDHDVISNLYEIAVGDIKPNLTIILDLPVEIGLERARARKSGGMRYESMGIEFHQRLREGFLQIADQEAERCVVIDGNQPVDKISKDIIVLIDQRFNPRRA